jgi:four helix bundle protein
MPKSFRELKVWEKAVDLTVIVYQYTTDFPPREVYGLTSQMRRASVSVASNIAEGSVRGTKKDFRQFVKIAQGSNCELQTQLIIARRLCFGDPAQRDQCEALSGEIGKMLSGLSQYLADRIRSAPKH